MQHLGNGGQAVGGAAGVGHESHIGGVAVLVHALSLIHISESVDAFVKHDTIKAEAVLAADDTVDAYFRQVKQALRCV